MSLRETCSETPFKTPAFTQERNKQNRHKSTPFKIPVISGYRVTREKDDANRVKDMVKNKGRKMSFKTQVSLEKGFLPGEGCDIGKNQIHFKTFKNGSKQEKTTNRFLSRPLMMGQGKNRNL